MTFSVDIKCDHQRIVVTGTTNQAFPAQGLQRPTVENLVNAELEPMAVIGIGIAASHVTPSVIQVITADDTIHVG